MIKFFVPKSISFSIQIRSLFLEKILFFVRGRENGQIDPREDLFDPREKVSERFSRVVVDVEKLSKRFLFLKKFRVTFT